MPLPVDPRSRFHRRRRWLVFAPALALSAFARAQADPPAPQPELPKVRLTAGFHLITAELAVTPEAQQRGLMMRTSLRPNHGMLFDFAQAGVHCMWMRHTLVPLSVAFIDAQGRIVNIEDMSPRSDDSHCSRAPARWALEMERGWFASRGLKAGAVITGLPR